MKISKIILKGFRSFRQETTINLHEDLTSIIGHNSSGKSAALLALQKLFGTSRSETEIKKSDFHIDIEENQRQIKEKSFFIEARCNFSSGDGNAVPEFFTHMVVQEPGGNPYLRIRLESFWKYSSVIPEGVIETKNFYIIAPEGTEISQESKHPIPQHHRGLIQLYYVPAIRMPSTQLKFVTGTILWRLINKISWDEDFIEEFNTKMDEVNSHLMDNPHFSDVRNTVANFWSEFHKDVRYTNSKLVFGESAFEEVLKKIGVEFTPTEIERPYRIDDLGEGLRSLFYLSLVCSLLKVENDIELSDDILHTKPVLNILAVEEPENHVAPQLLGKIVNNLSNIARENYGQVIISSHSSAIIKRISPEAISHFRIDTQSYETIVGEIKLPEKQDDAYKFIREAVTNYPELYFARLVIIGEGDSEDIIIRKLARAYGKPVDESGITVIPLGHRFVNHIWQLLEALNIPYLTLLDLDIERSGGGYGRIKYVLKQLIANGYKKEELLELSDGSIMTEGELNNMHKWKLTADKEEIMSWVKFLESYDVFFSYPLDIDFMMLNSFPEIYKTSILPSSGGPRIPDKNTNHEGYNNKIEKSIRATLKADGGNGDTYSDEEKDLMIWYNYHFLGRGKPSTHIAAMSELNEKDLLENIPEVLQRLFDRVKQLLEKDPFSV